MKTSLLFILFLLQGIPVPPLQGGSVSGILTDAGGKPLSEVRVAAVAVPQTAADAATGSAMGAVTQTDEAGRYRLENIPPGRYYIAAGRLDRPTYFPGTQEMGGGTILTIGAGTSMDGIAFRLQDASKGRALPGLTTSQGPPFILIPIEFRVADGSPVPVSGSAGDIMLRFDDASATPPSLFPVKSSFLQINGPGPLEYRVSIQNLPEGYGVDTMRWDNLDLRTASLKLPQSLWKGPSANTSTIYSVAAAIFLGTNITVSTAGPTLSVVQQANGANISEPLLITLNRMSAGLRTGATVRGKLSVEATSVTLSGRQGLVFSDGQFEFRNVPEGLHTVVAFGASPRVTALVVGEEDVAEVALQPTSVLPLAYDIPRVATAAERQSSGSALPLALLRGSVIDAETKEPLQAGTIYLTGGGFGTSRDLGPGGEFDIPALLPGSYKIEIQPFAHESISQTIVVEKDMRRLEFEAKETSP